MCGLPILPYFVSLQNRFRLRDCARYVYCRRRRQIYFEMGSFSSLAAGVKVWLSSNDYVNELVTHSVPEVKEIQGNVRLGKFTGVGTNSVIMPGNDIPEGVTIGALSFVPSGYQFEPWTVYAGRPIRAIKKRNRANIMRTLMKIGYIDEEAAEMPDKLCAE